MKFTEYDRNHFKMVLMMSLEHEPTDIEQIKWFKAHWEYLLKKLERIQP